jgi:hypothetical protein
MHPVPTARSNSGLAYCHVTMKPHPELVMYSAPTADSQFLSEKGRATRGSTGSTHKQAQ